MSITTDKTESPLSLLYFRVHPSGKGVVQGCVVVDGEFYTMEFTENQAIHLARKLLKSITELQSSRKDNDNMRCYICNKIIKDDEVEFINNECEPCLECKAVAKDLDKEVGELDDDDLSYIIDAPRE